MYDRITSVESMQVPRKRFGMINEDQLNACKTYAQFKVFHALAMCANKQGVCFPSIDTIIKNTGLHRTTVNAMLKQLIKVGLVVRIPSFNDAFRIYETPRVTKYQQRMAEDAERSRQADQDDVQRQEQNCSEAALFLSENLSEATQKLSLADASSLENRPMKKRERVCAGGAEKGQAEIVSAKLSNKSVGRTPSASKGSLPKAQAKPGSRVDSPGETHIRSLVRFPKRGLDPLPPSCAQPPSPFDPAAYIELLSGKPIEDGQKFTYAPARSEEQWRSLIDEAWSLRDTVLKNPQWPDFNAAKVLNYAANREAYRKRAARGLKTNARAVMPVAKLIEWQIEVAANEVDSLKFLVELHDLTAADLAHKVDKAIIEQVFAK